MYKLVYTQAAAGDLDSIYDYIANDSKQRASSYMLEIENTILKLIDFPQLGSKCKYVELQVQGIRVLIHDRYLIFYTINEQEKTINILRVLNGAQNFKNLF